MRDIRRIMIVGQPGSGKSTLARELGGISGLPVVHIDHIHWQPGWVERPRAEKSRLCREVEDREAWIFEGGHSATWATRLERADMVIWLDFPVGRRLWRIVKRTVVWRGRTRPDLPEGCAEGFHRETLPFWRFVWRTRNSARARIAKLIDGADPAKSVIVLGNLHEVHAFLEAARRDEPFSFRPVDPPNDT